LDVYNSNQENSCPYGTKIFSPESREDWKTFLASSVAVRNPHWIIDVTRPQDGCGGCEEFAMNSNKAEVATWRTSDLSPWFLRDTVHIPASYDYKANCYFNVFAFDTEDSIIYDAGSPTTDNPVESGGSCWIHSASYFCQGEKTTTTTTTTLAPNKCDTLPYTTSMCPSGYLKADQSTLDCGIQGPDCIDSDASDETCCEEKAKCDSYQALYCPSGVLADNAANTSCSATLCADSDADDTLCCTPKATCDTYLTSYCSTGVLVDNAAETECTTGTTCTDGAADDALCCKALATCDVYSTSYCSSGELVDNAAAIECTDTICADDDAHDALCCKPQEIPLADLVSGHNKNPPSGYVAKSGSGPCNCRGTGAGLDSCGELCCSKSPWTDPDPTGQYYYGNNGYTESALCYEKA